MSLNMYLNSYETKLHIILYGHALIFSLFSSDTQQVLMFVFPPVTELAFMDVVSLVLFNINLDYIGY